MTYTNELHRGRNAIELMGGPSAAAAEIKTGGISALLRTPNVGRKTASAVLALLEAQGELDPEEVLPHHFVQYWRELRRLRELVTPVAPKVRRSETVTVRLDPRMNYLAELAARSQRRTKSSFIEWAVQEAIKGMDLGHCAHCGAPTNEGPDQ